MTEDWRARVGAVCSVCVGRCCTDARNVVRLVANPEEDELAAAICRIGEPDTVRVGEMPREYHDHRH